jgi:hypothetical protein
VAGSGNDAIDDCSLGISIVLNKRPFSLSQGQFRSSIQLAVRGVDVEPISKHQHSVDLRTANRERVEVDVRVGPFEHPVLVRVSLSDVKSLRRDDVASGAGSKLPRTVEYTAARLPDGSSAMQATPVAEGMIDGEPMAFRFVGEGPVQPKGRHRASLSVSCAWECLSTTPGAICHSCTSRPRPSRSCSLNPEAWSLQAFF